MELYAGLDLHSQYTYIGVLEKGSMRKVFQMRVSNELQRIISALEPFRNELQGIAIESTFNCYWLVDGLMGRGQKGKIGQQIQLEFMVFE